MIKAGKLRHRVKIQYPAESQDQETGALNVTWITKATVWASIEPISAREFIAAQSEDSKVSARITIRYRSDIDAKMRIYHEAKDLYYNIEGVLSDKDSGYEYLTLPVSEGLMYIGHDYIDPIYVTHNGEVVTHNGIPVTYTENPDIITYLGNPVTYLGEFVTYTE